MKAKNMWKNVTAMILCVTMLLGQSILVQAAEKATIKTVTDVSFKSAAGAAEQYDGTKDVVTLNNCTIFFRWNNSGKDELVYTKDGKKYARTDLKKKLQETAKISSKKAQNASFSGMSVIDGKVVVVGTYNSNGMVFYMTTKNCKTFTYQAVSKFKSPYGSVEMMKAGSTYILMHRYAEGADEIKTDGNSVTALIKCYVSNDMKKWSVQGLPMHGIINAEGEYEYDDVNNKENRYIYLSGVMTEGEYLYAGFYFLPYNEPGFYEEDEYYVYRTKDFSSWEKLIIPCKDSIEGLQHYEDFAKARGGVGFGISVDWKNNMRTFEGKMSNMTLSRAEDLSNDFTEIFTYKPKAYSSKTLSFTYHWNSDGTNVSLLFEREKGNSLFVSKDGKGNFREYKTSIKASKCGNVCADDNKGYLFMGYNNMKYLLISRDGFVTSYKVKLPSGVQAMVINGNQLLLSCRKGCYYINLSSLYSKLR